MYRTIPSLSLHLESSNERDDFVGKLSFLAGLLWYLPPPPVSADRTTTVRSMSTEYHSFYINEKEASREICQVGLSSLFPRNPP